MNKLEAVFMHQHLWDASQIHTCATTAGQASLGLPLSLFGTLSCVVIAGLPFLVKTTKQPQTLFLGPFSMEDSVQSCVLVSHLTQIT